MHLEDVKIGETYWLVHDREVLECTGVNSRGIYDGVLVRVNDTGMTLKVRPEVSLFQHVNQAVELARRQLEDTIKTYQDMLKEFNQKWPLRDNILHSGEE